MMQSYLNEENLQKSAQGDVEWHPLRPFLPPNARVLFLGSFPPPRQRWCIDFFYPNYINDHWRIEGLVWYGNKNHFVDEANKTFRLPEIIDIVTLPLCSYANLTGEKEAAKENFKKKINDISVPLKWDEFNINQIAPE